MIMFAMCVYEGKKKKCAFIGWFEKFGAVDAATGCRLVKPQTMRIPFFAGQRVCLIACAH